MTFNWMALLSSVAPSIATALGGPLAGLGTKALIGALGLADDAKESDIAAAMASATPDQLLALKKADQDFAVKMRELDIDLEKVNAADRDSARTMQTQTRSYVPAVLAILVTLGFFGALAYMLGHGMPKDAAGNEAMLIMLGSLGTAWMGVISFYFGSSMGSAKKDEVLAAMRR
jgi:membrane-bound ClpP family serine protease